MIIKVRVVPNSKVPSFEEDGAGGYRIKVREKAVGGAANSAAIRSIAQHFGIKESEVRIMRGQHGREKLVEIP